MKDFLNSKGIFIDVEIYSSTGNKYRLSELLTEYSQALQLLQTDVIKSVCKHEYITDANWKSATCRLCN